MGKPKNVIDQLRQTIIDADVSRYRIAKDTGLDRSMLHRFVHTEAAMRMDAFAKLCDYFGLRLVQTAKPKRKGK
jgi:DNA-binding phage protein